MEDAEMIKLVESLLQAADECRHLREEEGGIILNNADDYTFVKIKNIYEGSHTAYGLYETDLQELSSKVFSKLTEGWRMYASFHTHPTFAPTPSNTDITKLFEGFKTNYIYSPIKQTFSVTSWGGEHWHTHYVTKENIENLKKELK